MSACVCVHACAYSVAFDSLLSHVLCSLPGSSSMESPRQEYWNGLPFPSPGDLPDPGIKSMSPALQEDSLLLSHQGAPLEYYSAIKE